MNNIPRGPVIFGIVLLAAIVMIGAWIYTLQPSGGLNLGVTLSTNPSKIVLGDQFTVSVALSNDSGSGLQNATIALVLPANVISTDSPGQRVVSQSIGSVDSGGVSHEDFHLIATGSVNSISHFTAKVTYNTSQSSAQFESDGSLDVPIGLSAVSLNITAPANVLSGQNFPITVQYQNNTNDAIAGATVAMQYPPAFNFVSVSSSLEASGNDTWNLGTIPPNGSGMFTVTGNLEGPNDASYPIAATLSENISGQNYTISNPAANVVLAESPLSLSIVANETQNYVAHPGDSLNYTLLFKNNSTVTFQNITIAAHLAGSMFDYSTVMNGGSFDSITDTVNWNGAASPQLLSLAPGQSGSVNFTIRTKSAFPIRLLSDKDYSVSVNAILQSPTVPAGTTADATMSVANITTKFGGNIVLAEQGYHKDPESLGFTNTGSYPPAVNKPTQYTIHWLITNYATDAGDVNISAYLQSGTTCTGKMVFPASTTLMCNPANGQVTWQIPVVPATTGIADKPLEAVFQVTNTPGVNQVGQTPTLIGSVQLTATDLFTSSTMRSSVDSLSTALPSDTSVSQFTSRGVTQ